LVTLVGMVYNFLNGVPLAFGIRVWIAVFDLCTLVWLLICDGAIRLGMWCSVCFEALVFGVFSILWLFID